MSDTTCTTPRTGAAAALAAYLRATWRRQRREAGIRAAVRQLSRFDDNLLRDIGVPRGEIETRVRGKKTEW